MRFDEFSRIFIRAWLPGKHVFGSMDRPKVYYFDCNATTRVAPEVVEAMLPFFHEHWGNPSSAYAFGSNVVQHIAYARRKLAALIHADPREIIFTSCGTESNNAAIHSALASQPGKRHLVTTAVEHSAVLNYCRSLEKQGVTTTYLPVDSTGSLDLSLMEKAIRADTALVSVMYANNETGVVFPIPEIGAICRKHQVPFHTDAVQAAGKIPLDVRQLGVDFLSLSAHKLNAPKGIGLLYVGKKTKFAPFVIGGHQERGRRGGTENVPYIAGFGRAADLALERLDEENTRVRELRDILESMIVQTIPSTRVNGAGAPRLPNTLNVSIDYVEAEALLMLLDQAGICASSGSACTTGSLDPSHVLTAMGLTPAQARGSLRLSLSVENTLEEVQYLAEQLRQSVQRLRSFSPLAQRGPAMVHAQ